ncbi:MAG: copper chaperone PCu(A)C, partial [Betaproteobacteria bacterium]|nr:copper chaperone PCu(A)C [Betaproteobacteria bacterium]
MRLGLILLLCAALPAWAQVSVEQPWSRATPPGSKIGVGFMQLRNSGAAAERIVGASSPLAGRVEMHVTTREGDVMKMRQVESLEIPAGGTFELKPGGAHLMLMDLKRPLAEGARVPLTLRLENGGVLNVELTVQKMGARSP